MLDISFKAQEIIHYIKLTAYTTTSNKRRKTISKTSSKFQVHPKVLRGNFMLPWCMQVIKAGKYDENIGKVYANALREEIKRLDHHQLDSNKAPKNAAETPEVCNAKCVLKAYSFGGLNPQNKSAVGECDTAATSNTSPV